MGCEREGGVCEVERAKNELVQGSSVGLVVGIGQGMANKVKPQIGVLCLPAWCEDERGVAQLVEHVGGGEVTVAFLARCFARNATTVGEHLTQSRGWLHSIPWGFKVKSRQKGLQLFRTATKMKCMVRRRSEEEEEE